MWIVRLEFGNFPESSPFLIKSCEPPKTFSNLFDNNTNQAIISASKKKHNPNKRKEQNRIFIFFLKFHFEDLLMEILKNSKIGNVSQIRKYLLTWKKVYKIFSPNFNKNEILMNCLLLRRRFCNYPDFYSIFGRNKMVKMQKFPKIRGLN